ncbi:hypothetical protein ABB37_07490 [Leptomonas pyrrhocoris]|uniref:F-box domain-containing protein n=1 Tax=Leptomonas pyrrhocoris TaxID=157538 RepID=A0A0N0DT64_LEPPY|nr:hypothetical protein ABB37_07490 [Leptomonas pyrrhocoris]KPA76631.1 hypothetical protein ABB37_07490 [Leptomonas pyrrhocoris]|eukprot:XP_015655070.1 hypothetical protein ABB37_07490 [Leptomonas pyrrhocoris]
MSTWASRLSTAAKSVTSSPVTEGHIGRHRTGTSTSSSAVASPLNVGSGAPAAAAVTANDATSSDVREEFRRVAEKYNEESACMLRLPPDCWDLLTEFLSYVDVVALGQTCRSLWVVLHERDSVWWRQLAYLHQDVRDLRGGNLLCTAPLFPRPPPDVCMSQSESLIPSPITAPSSSTARVVEGRLRSFAAHPRRSDWVPMSAYERFFQERRVYVLDAHREWHFQELADVEDKATGMFTVALHDGRFDFFSSPHSSDAASPPFVSAASPPPAQLPRSTASAVTTPIQAATDSARDTSPNVPPSPISLMPPQVGRALFVGATATATAAPTPHRRTTSNQTSGTSAGNSPAFAPSPTPPPPSPPLLPRVGDPIINAHNPLLQLRLYTIDVHGAERRLHGAGNAEDDEDEGGEGGNHTASGSGSRMNGSHGLRSSATEPPANLAGMSDDEVLAYVMQLSLEEAQAATRQSPALARATPPVAPPQTAHELPQGGASSTPTAATADPMCWPHNHYRGAPGATSLPLSELLTVIDSINNNALDQLHHHKVRDCTADEDPKFVRRLAETLRSAKHRRLHLGNHHRAVRNNGQTTRNRAGRIVNADSGAAFSVSVTSGAGGGASSPQPPPPPPPMNRMLRGFHGDLLEITQREARMVANKLLGKPNIIDDFVVFHCYDPGELYRRLCPASMAYADAAPAPAATTAPTLSTTTPEVKPPAVSAGRQVMKHGTLISVPAPLYVDPVAGDAVKTNSAPASPSMLLRTVMREPALTALPFFTRFFLAPELCHDGYVALLVVDVVRVLVVVDKEVVSTDNPDWASPLIDRGGRVVVPGQGYNPQAYTRSEYNYVPPNPPRRNRESN